MYVKGAGATLSTALTTEIGRGSLALDTSANRKGGGNAELELDEEEEEELEDVVFTAAMSIPARGTEMASAAGSEGKGAVVSSASVRWWWHVPRPTRSSGPKSACSMANTSWCAGLRLLPRCA
jgi:hypothetical protein